MRDGQVVLAVSVDEVALTEALVRGGLLAPGIDDREALTKALEKQIAILIDLAAMGDA